MSLIDKGGTRQKNTHGRKSEKRVSRDLGFREVANSGAMHGNKSDAVGDAFRLECKSTINDSIKVDYSWLRKISHEALSTGLRPALSVSFVTGSGSQKPDGDWVMLRLSDFEELKEKVHEVY